MSAHPASWPAMKMRCSSTAYLDLTDATTFIRYAESSTDDRFLQHAGVAAHGRQVRAPSSPELHALHVLSLRVASGTASTKADCRRARGELGIECDALAEQVRCCAKPSPAAARTRCAR